MDETDIAISFMLLQNSRIPYRALAEKLNLSVNAVHKRIQNMVESGIIRGFTAQASLKVTGSLIAYIYGQARARNKKPDQNRLFLKNTFISQSISWKDLRHPRDRTR